MCIRHKNLPLEFVRYHDHGVVIAMMSQLTSLSFKYDIDELKMIKVQCIPDAKFMSKLFTTSIENIGHEDSKEHMLAQMYINSCECSCIYICIQIKR